MTLILAYINPDFAIIAADRRVALSNGRLVDDTFTKTAIIYNRFLVSFTGLAKLGSQHAMEWFVYTAAKHRDFNLNKIADEATAKVKQLNVSKKYARLAFMCMGYSQEDRISYRLITNMHAQDGKELAFAEEAFRVLYYNPEVRSTIETLGWPIPAAINRNMRERLRKIHKQNLPTEKRVIDILAGTIAKSSGEFISKTSLITVLRRKGGGSFSVVTPGAKLGQTVDIASPYVLFPSGAVVVMPNQQLRRAKPPR